MRWIKTAAHEIHRRDIWKVLALYAGVSWGALEVVGLFVERGILPEGAFLGTLVVLIVFLPVFVATAIVQRGLPEWMDPLPEPSSDEPQADTPRLRELLTWRRAVVASVFALAMVGIGAGAYMAMRVTGIGSPGTLLAQGVIEEGERIILADFQSTVPALPGQVVTEALRINLGQSPTIRPLSNAELHGVLARMEADPADPLGETRAREVALRAGVKAFLAGEVSSVGGRFLLTARIVDAAEARNLVSFQETARDTTSLLDAIDRLGKAIRDKAGESLRSIQANLPLQQVTTASLEALRMYSQGEEVERAGDFQRAAYLYREAVRLDSSFAMAHRKLGVQLDNTISSPTERAAAYRRAFELRDQLPPIERFLADASYHQNVSGNLAAAADAYENVLDLDPNQGVALNNLGVLLIRLGDPAGAERVFRRAISFEPSSANYVNLVRALVPQGKAEEVDRTLLEWEDRFPEVIDLYRDRALVAFVRGRYQEADSILVEMPSRFPRQLGAVFHSTAIRWGIAGVEGKWSKSESLGRRFIQIGRELGLPAWCLNGELIMTGAIVYMLSDTARATAELDRAREEYPLESMPPLDRPYLRLARTALMLGLPATADSVYQEFLAEVPEEAAPDILDEDPREVEALLSIARGDLGGGIEGLKRLRDDCEVLCRVRVRFSLGEAFEKAGSPEEAVAAYEDYVAYPVIDRLQADGFRLPQAMLRIARLHDELGDSTEAAAWYRRFADLWSNADPELLPRAEQARRRAAELENAG